MRGRDGVVEMVCGALAVQGPVIGPPRLALRFPVLAQLARFALVGGLGTVANAVLFLVLRNWFDALPANLVALLLSTALSTEVNRRFTFGGARAHRWRAHVQTGGTVAFYAFYTSAVLVLLHAVVPDAGAVTESVVVAASSVFGGLARFLVLRQWVFRRVPQAAAVGS